MAWNGSKMHLPSIFHEVFSVHEQVFIKLFGKKLTCVTSFSEKIRNAVLKKSNVIIWCLSHFQVLDGSEKGGAYFKVFIRNFKMLTLKESTY